MTVWNAVAAVSGNAGIGQARPICALTMFKSKTVTNCATKSLSHRLRLCLLDSRRERFISPPRFRPGGNIMKPAKTGVMTYMKQRANMFNRTPKPDFQAASILPEPPAADYSDELNAQHLERLRNSWSQDEATMGPVVHEFRW